MFGFAPNLMDSGVQKFTPNADSGFPKITQKEIFYSVRDGNFSDINSWATASGRVGKIPTAIDDVYVRHNINFNSTDIFINALYLSNNITITLVQNITFNILDIRKANFIIGNGTTTINKLLTIVDGTLTNKINLIINYPLDYETIKNGILDITSFPNQLEFIFNNDYFIPIKNFHSLRFTGGGQKYLTGDTIINGNLTSTGSNNLECSTYNLSVFGSTFFSFTSFSKTGSGNLLFVGNLNITGAPISLTGNPTIEFRGGIFKSGSAVVDMGNGDINFTTNNQITSGSSYGITFNNRIFIASGITLDFNAPVAYTFNNIINGVSATSKLVCSGNSNNIFGTQLAAENSMSVGIFDFTTSPNQIGYTGNYTATIPSYFNTFHNLTISGTGTKSLGVNTTLNGNLITQTNGQLQCSIYDLFVGGTTTMLTNAYFMKSGSGNITMVGIFNANMGANQGLIDFSGNPTIEFRGGLTGDRGNDNIVSGTGTWRFTTNNQTWDFANRTWTINAQISIENITLFLNGYSNVYRTQFNNFINGTTSVSKLQLLSNSVMYYAYTSGSIMTTGIFDYSLSTTSLGFVMNANFTLPSTTFTNKIIINGTGIKTLLGNTTFYKLEIYSVGRIDFTIYDVIINDETKIVYTSTTAIEKTSSGNVQFNGLLSIAGGNSAIDFSVGNPTIEFRNGIGGDNGKMFMGTSLIRFTTNNQQFDYGNKTSLSILNNIQIENIELTIFSFSSVQGITLNGVINGTTSISKLINKTGQLNYKSATQPMATGILDTSTNLNTWIYGLNNQDIKGSPTISPKQVYRNLTLNGTGVKTLQGYVSVLNTYTLTSPATLALNSYTLTNP